MKITVRPSSGSMNKAVRAGHSTVVFSDEVQSDQLGYFTDATNGSRGQVDIIRQMVEPSELLLDLMGSLMNRE